jgi:hypothetical protein
MTSRSLLTLGSKFAPPLAPAHGQAGERVLENLLEAEKLEH